MEYGVVLGMYVTGGLVCYEFSVDQTMPPDCLVKNIDCGDFLLLSGKDMTLITDVDKSVEIENILLHKNISYKKKTCMSSVTMYGAGLGKCLVFRVLSILGERGIDVYKISCSDIAISFVVEEKTAEKLKAVLSLEFSFSS